MPSAPARFAIEAALLVSLGIALAVADVDLLLFAAIVAATLAVLAALERTVLQGPGRRGARSLDDDEQGLPLHEPGVEREHPAAPVADATVAAAAAVEVTVEPVVAPTPTWRPPVVEDSDEDPEREAAELDAAAAAREDGGELTREPEPVGEPGAAASPALPQANADPGREREAAGEPEATSPVPSPAAQASRRPVAVPALPAEEPEPEPEPERPTSVVELPTRGPREWNLWDLERRARERSGEDVIQDEEWGALFVHLREYASPDGMLPAEFDELVRESFAGLLAAGSR